VEVPVVADCDEGVLGDVEHAAEDAWSVWSLRPRPAREWLDPVKVSVPLSAERGAPP